MAYNYTTALATLNDADKNRMLAIFLNSEAATNNSLTNWQKATTEYGAASIDSMKVMFRAALKKVEKAEANGGVPPPTPAKPKKRKTAATPTAEANGEDADETSKPKAKRTKKTKKATPKPASGDEADGEATIKADGSDDD